MLARAEELALAIDESVAGVYQAKGEFAARDGDYPRALDEYRKAVAYSKERGLANPRAYTSAANFIAENALALSAAGLSAAHVYAEAEGLLREVVDGADFGWRSKLSSANMLGRLVGGTIRDRATRQPVTYSYGGKGRPNYAEALEVLEQSFESVSPDRFDPEKKTWQDVMSHVVVKDVLVGSVSQHPVKERAECLALARKHFLAAFEGLPNHDLDSAQVREHVVSTMDAYADFLWERLATEGGGDPAQCDREADGCYVSAIHNMEQWGLDCSPRFQNRAGEVYKHRAVFLWTRRVKRRQTDSKSVRFGPSPSLAVDWRQIPAIPLDAESERALREIIELNRKLISVLSGRRPDYRELLIDAHQRILFALRSGTESAIKKMNHDEEALKWASEYVDSVSEALEQCNGDGKLMKQLRRFMEHREIYPFLNRNMGLRKKVVALLGMYQK